jgi:hypothetical protein
MDIQYYLSAGYFVLFAVPALPGYVACPDPIAIGSSESAGIGKK